MKSEKSQFYLKKAWRFCEIYGLRRTLFKIAGRLRSGKVLSLFRKRHFGSIGIIGCGQFSFATIGFFLQRKASAGVKICFDTDEDAARTFAEFYATPVIAAEASTVFDDDSIDLVYIASNHASHTEYALSSMKSGKRTYVEKPIAVTAKQLGELCQTQRDYNAKIYAGYNRPFSKAIRDLRSWCDSTNGPLTFSCFVSGHVLPEDHWYRDPAEGTRVCGNIGHWLDLAVHMLSWGELPDSWEISLCWSNVDVRDDDLAISLISKRGDLINIVVTSRTEPFEGVNETINLQWGNAIARIDDFRRLSVWKEQRKKVFRYWPKDVGHSASIMQPFGDDQRDWREVELSSLLIIRIAEMVATNQHDSAFSFSQAWASLEVE